MSLNPCSLSVYGIPLSPLYWECVSVAEDICHHVASVPSSVSPSPSPPSSPAHPLLSFSSHPLTEDEYEAEIRRLSRLHPSLSSLSFLSPYSSSSSSSSPSSSSSSPVPPPVIIHSSLGVISLNRLIQWAEDTFKYDGEDTRRSDQFKHIMRYFDENKYHFLSQLRVSQQNPLVFFDLAIEPRSSASAAAATHRLVFELYRHLVPLTVENFLSLCTGSNELKATYEGSSAHRSLRSAFIQFGDWTDSSGSHSVSPLYNTHAANERQRGLFADESFVASHDRCGTLSMSNCGKDTNGSQFFLSLQPIPAFNGKFVVFGRCVSGMAELRSRSNDGASSVAGVPQHRIRINKCGVIDVKHVDSDIGDWIQQKKESNKLRKKEENGSRLSSIVSSPSRAATLLFIGLDGSGKSSVVNRLNGCGKEKTKPTVGFELQRIHWGDSYRLTLYGLGGAENLRGYWNNYYDAAHGIVFIIDAANVDERGSLINHSDLSSLINQLLSHPYIKGKPILFFANKQDKPGALTATEIDLALSLSSFRSSSQPIHVQKCIAYNGEDEGIDMGGDGERKAPKENGLYRGLEWLLNEITRLSPALQERVQRETFEVKQAGKAKLQAVRDKVAAEKEREKQTNSS